MLASQHRKAFNQTKAFIILVAEINECFASQRKVLEQQLGLDLSD
jgi:hypothetical protein